MFRKAPALVVNPPLDPGLLQKEAVEKQPVYNRTGDLVGACVEGVLKIPTYS